MQHHTVGGLAPRCQQWPLVRVHSVSHARCHHHRGHRGAGTAVALVSGGGWWWVAAWFAVSNSANVITDGLDSSGR